VRRPFFGHSFDGFAPGDEASMAAFRSRLSCIQCRDNESLYYLRGIGVKSGVLEFGPDGYFGIDPLNDASAKHGVKRWMFRDLGWPVWLLDIERDEALRVLEQLMQIRADPAYARAKVSRGMAAVHARDLAESTTRYDVRRAGRAMERSTKAPRVRAIRATVLEGASSATA
jgi:hypothetical protein